MLLPRHCARLSIPLLTLPLACTGDDGSVDDEIGTDETGDGDGDGDGGLCTEPGTTVPDFDPYVPPQGTPLPTCSAGWASDAPLEEAQWAILIPEDSGYGFPPTVKALPTGALLVTDTSLQWIDDQGQLGPEVEHGSTQFVRRDAVSVAADGHVFVAVGVNDDIAIREFADGALVDEVTVVTPGVESRPVGLFPFSADEWLIVGDEWDDTEFVTEAFFMRVDATGTELVRKATPTPYSYYYSSNVTLAALDADGDLLFGTNNQQWIVEPIEGMVINTNAALANPADVAGSAAGAGFVSLTLQTGSSVDAVATFISPFGATQWSQTYDRALTPDQFFDAAARPGGGFVAAGIDGLWWTNDGFETPGQPLVVAFDESGNAQWTGRLAIPGLARSVDADASHVVAAGQSTTGEGYDDLDSWIWVASW